MQRIITNNRIKHVVIKRQGVSIIHRELYVVNFLINHLSLCLVNHRLRDVHGINLFCLFSHFQGYQASARSNFQDSISNPNIFGYFILQRRVNFPVLLYDRMLVLRGNFVPVFPLFLNSTVILHACFFLHFLFLGIA